MGEMRNACGVMVRKFNLEGLGIGGRIILEWIIRKWGKKL
jgi:hypothetical protein